MELREMEEKDLKGRKRLFDIRSFIRRPEILNIIVDNIGPSQAAEEVNLSSIRIQYATGSEISFDDFLMAFKMGLHKGQPGKIVEQTFDMKGANLLHEDKSRVTPIRAITLKGRLNVRDANLRWNIVDEIWMIMKLLFEEKSFTITRSGIIKEDKK